MAEYPQRWFANTGKYGPYVDGISKPVYRDIITGEETDDLPPGALYVIKRHGDHPYPPKGYDGFSVACVVPYSADGTINKTSHWYIYGRANNCTMPDDDAHRCWCRHGSFGEIIHVDKTGNTCQAGAGSIAVPGFHGFLHNGILKDC